MAKTITCLVILGGLVLITDSQMMFPENDYFYQQSSYIGRSENVNSPIDAGYSDGLASGNVLIPADYNRYTALSNGINNFALKINRALLSANNNENIVLSPLSITGALALLLLGSIGQTYNEIAEALGFFQDIGSSQNVHRDFGMYIDKLTGNKLGDDLAIFKPNISYASAVFLQEDYPIREQYEDFIRNVYRSVIRHVDYKNRPQDARNVINSWVSEMTKGRIENILASNPQQNTRIILANALYFKAEWEKYFMGELTSRSNFFLDKRHPKQTVKVDLMGNIGMFPYYKNKELMIVGLPYKGNNTFLYAVKPVDATKKTIKEIVNEMTAESLEELIQNTKYQSTIVTFPKMKLSSSTNLRQPLESMGIRSVFSSVQSNLALLSPVQNKPSTSFIQNTHDSDDDVDFIFTRFGEEKEDEKLDKNCTSIFQNKSPDGTTCTIMEKVNNKNVTVVYKQIGDKIGRRVINEIPSRRRRQAGFEDWNPGLYVDDVLHKVDMDITETGTEAAAATLVLITRDGRRPVFAGNEPFFFVIRDEETKIILFSSVVYKPYPNYG